MALHDFLFFVALSKVVLFFFLSLLNPGLLTIYTSLLGRLFTAFLSFSCFQYILWVSNSPRPLSSLWSLEISTVFSFFLIMLLFTNSAHIYGQPHGVNIAYFPTRLNIWATVKYQYIKNWFSKQTPSPPWKIGTTQSS